MKHIQTLKAAALAAFTIAGGAVSAQAQTTIETVTVGNIGNAADTTGYGAVGYSYNIGKYEVTNTQYTAFLNAVAATDTFNLYNTQMSGIGRTGSSGSYSYTVNGGFANKPVNYVSFWDATRFANWQSGGSTETGSYTLTSGGISANTITRNEEANWVVASENEWYKAAYYDPNKGGADIGGYWLYPTRSNTITTADANYAFFVDDATDVGAYGSDASAYGTFDQGGNMWELNEVIFNGFARGLRGTSWANFESGMRSTVRDGAGATEEAFHIGFRVASLAPIPEPSTFGAAMGVMAFGVVTMRRRRARGTL